eukprot:jgi/Hompol1/249/HPOL_004116-RA
MPPFDIRTVGTFGVAAVEAGVRINSKIVAFVAVNLSFAILDMDNAVTTARSSSGMLSSSGNLRAAGLFFLIAAMVVSVMLFGLEVGPFALEPTDGAHHHGQSSHYAGNNNSSAKFMSAESPSSYRGDSAATVEQNASYGQMLTLSEIPRDHSLLDPETSSRLQLQPSASPLEFGQPRPVIVQSGPSITAAAAANNGETFQFRAQALFSYESNPDDPMELSFKKDEILEVLEIKGKWWQARRVLPDGTVHRGIVPSNYLRVV